MKLINYSSQLTLSGNSMKWTFTVQLGTETRSFILREKPDWPCLYGEPIAKVEAWLFKRYSDLCYLAFGIL